MNRKILAIFSILLLGAPPAIAVPTAIPIKPVPIISEDSGAEGLGVSGKTIVTYENSQQSTLDIVVTGRDITGSALWTHTIDSGQDEIATALTIDSRGDIWLAGSSNKGSEIPGSETQTVFQNPINPDSVETVDEGSIRSDMKVLNIWRISSTGESKTSLSLELENPVLASAISVTTKGLSVIATSERGPLLFNATIQGVFSKPITIGSTKTQLTSITRNEDGSVQLFGSSSEKLAGKSLAGKQDGVLIRANSLGKILTTVRSSVSNGFRTWSSSTSTNFLTGFVTSGGKSEIAITKFSSKFIPTWTTRIPGSGNSIGVNGPRGTFFVVLEPKVLKEVKNWSPAKGQGAILIFSPQGIMNGAFSNSDLGSVISASFSKEIGFVVLAKKRGSNSAAIFHVNFK